MQFRWLLLVAILCLAAIDLTSSLNVWKLAKANGGFAFRLYNNITKGENGNVFFSPFSISTALSMTYVGARGKTANEMRRVLGFKPLSFNVHNSFRTTLTLLNAANGQYTLEVANRLFARNGLSIRRRFVNLVSRKYLAGLDELDFAGNPSGAAAFINQWVEQNTNNKIRNIVNANAVRNTLLSLANAIYFKGFWDKPFDPKYTRPGTFHVSSSQTKTVNMMHMTAKFAYSDNRYLNCKILAVPYKEERLAVYVLLPRQKNGLASLERKINFNSVTSAYLLRRIVVRSENDDMYKESFENNAILSQTPLVPVVDLLLTSSWGVDR